MDRPQPSVLTAVLWAYWDLYRVLTVMWRLWLIAFVILCAGVFVSLIGPVLLTYDPVGQVLARQVVLAGLCFLLTPLLLAIHRFVIMGEVADRYRFDVASPRFRLYFGWLVIAAILLSIPSFLDALTTPRGLVYYIGGRFPDAAPSMIVELARRFAAFVVGQCFLILYPAVAVQAAGATWQNAVRDTFKRIWFVIFASMLPFIPLVLLTKAATSLMLMLPRTYVSAGASVILPGTMFLLTSMLAAVIASRLYQIVGDRLNTCLRPT